MLEGHTALVTGGAQGIGLAVVKRLCADACSVLLADVDERGGSVAEDITAAGGRCAFAQVDLADRRQRDTLVDRAVKTWGSLDILVNNAAWLGERRPLSELSYEDWDRVMEVNLASAVFLARDAAAQMRSGGSIVNLSAIQDRLPLPSHVPYGTSKGAISALTRALAVELGPRGIRVNAVAPGGIETPSMADTRLSLGVGDADPSGSPALLQRPGSAQEVAEVVSFLASPRASYLTGVVVTVDGGRTLSRRPDPLSGGTDAGTTREVSQAMHSQQTELNSGLGSRGPVEDAAGPA